MDLRQLRYFVVLAEELHFRRAADRLNITQPPLSLAIQKLEREFGAKLFHRTQRRVALSEIGIAFREKALTILDLIEDSRRGMRDVLVGEMGSLRIGFTTAASLMSFFPDLIYQFRKKFPNVHVVLREVISSDQVGALQRREIDVGFLRQPTGSRPPGISFAKLTSEKLVVAMHRGHPLAGKSSLKIADLKDESFIFYPRQSGIPIHDLLIQLCAKRAFSPKIIQEAREGTTIIGLAATGLGIAIVPSGLRYIRVRNIVFKPLSDPDAVTEILLISRAGETSAQVANFRQLAKAAVPMRKPTEPPDGKR